MIWIVTAILLAFGGFVLFSSLAAVLVDPWWARLAAGLVFCLITPLAISWDIRHKRGWRRPTTADGLALVNGVLLAGWLALAPGLSGRALRDHGSWWVEEPARRFGDRRPGAVAMRVQSVISAVSRLLIGTGPSLTPRFVPAPRVARAAVKQPDSGPSGSASPRDGGVRETSEHPAGDGHAVRFERRGQNGIIVKVRLVGPERTLEVPMLFDTGATLTTVDRATVEALGLVTDGAPQVTVQTAAGRVRQPLIVLDQVGVGRSQVSDGLTVAICEACRSDTAVGLLGLNFTRHFKVTLDHENGTLTLIRKPSVDRLGDIRPFVELREIRATQRDQRVTISLVVKNSAPRMLQELEITGRTDGSADPVIARAVLRRLGPGEQRNVALRCQVPRGARPAFKVEVSRASW